MFYRKVLNSYLNRIFCSIKHNILLCLFKGGKKMTNTRKFGNRRNSVGNVVGGADDHE